MIFFEEASLRLKQQLKATEDKAVAEALGLTASAWKQRKARDAFPEKELYALAAKRPELGLDVAYVLTGITAEAHGRLAELDQAIQLAARNTNDINEIKARSAQLVKQVGLNALEASLVAAYRASSSADREALLCLAAFFEQRGGK